MAKTVYSISLNNKRPAQKNQMFNLLIVLLQKAQVKDSLAKDIKRTGKKNYKFRVKVVYRTSTIIVTSYIIIGMAGYKSKRLQWRRIV